MATRYSEAGQGTYRLLAERRPGMDILRHRADALSSAQGHIGNPMANTEPVVLHSLLGMHPNTRALKTGEVSSPLVTFDYFDVKVANTQFKAMVRDAKYDFGELAMVTFLQA